MAEADEPRAGGHVGMLGTRHREGRSRPPVACAVDPIAHAPWLFEPLTSEERHDAWQASKCDGFQIAKGRFAYEELEHTEGVALVVLKGHLCRSTSIRSGTVTELLGSGDVGSLHRTPNDTPETHAWLALSDSTVMIVDRSWLRRMTRWPDVAAALWERLARGLAQSSRERAVRECASVEERLHLTLHDLAGRWGRQVAEGALIDIEGLTHGVLAALIGSRRATVTSAMTQLTQSGALKRTVDRRWILLDATA